jgi:UTP--glucose-1-phosphate uridylyltransferase
MNRKVTKAVFPVAGFGSRFLPATKASPKEMMPVVDKPLIQYAVEEAVAAGITDLIFVTGRHKRAIEDHFDKAYELETALSLAGRADLLAQIQNIVPRHVNCIYLRQAEPLGLGHAVLCAAHLIQDEPFAVLLADDLMDTEPGVAPVLAQMVEQHARSGASLLAVQDVPRELTAQYGIVSTLPNDKRTERVTGIVEKPRPDVAPGTLAVVGRYILSSSVFGDLEKVQPGAGREIQLTDGIAALVARETVFAYRYEGVRYDCGSKLGYLKATVAFGMKHRDVGAEFVRHLHGMRGE